MDEPMSSKEQSRRDIDEVSIASDFSIIPENISGPEGGEAGEEGLAMASRGRSLPILLSTDLHPTLAAQTSYGKVLFQNIQATYTTDTDIAVSYVVTESVVAKSSDRIALYHVGFTSPQDYLGYQWAPTPSSDHRKNDLPLTVIFKASSLPKDAGEFFQFCYVSHEGNIVGVSTPFQLLPVGGAGVVEVDEGDGVDSIVFVHTNQSVLHDRINKLEREKESLVCEVTKAKEVREGKILELEEKTQQLNMCQHHLQALETKMKKETGEKCELMGHIGQVVEEKGHLEDRVRTLERSLVLATSKVDTLQEQYDQADSERQVLEVKVLEGRKEKELLNHSLTAAMEELHTTLLKLKNTEELLEKAHEEKSEAVRNLEFWTSTAAIDQTEKNSLALKFTTVNEELINKLEELEQTKRETKELELKFTDTVVELLAAKEWASEAECRLKVAEEDRDIQGQRQEVVSQDNVQLQATLTQLKERLEQLEQDQKHQVSGREAAETIASDLSGRLQAAKAEYQAIALTNIKLVKKVKKLRAAMPNNIPLHDGAMSNSVGSNVSLWLQADVGVDGTITEEPVEAGTIMDGDSGMYHNTTTKGFSMGCSFMGSEVAGSGVSDLGGSEIHTCTSCSNTTRELSEVVNRKMEAVVKELSQQIYSLKSQLHQQGMAEELCQQGETVEQQPCQQGEAAESQLEETIADIMQKADVQAEADTQQDETNTHQDEGPAGQQKESESQGEQEPVAVGEGGDERTTAMEGEGQEERVAEEQDEASRGEERPVLYGNTFLPTAPTAPVFLPEHHGTKTTLALSCHALTPSQDQAPTHPSASHPTQSYHATSHYRHPPTTQPLAAALPPPLQPETTTTAIQAAVMSQFPVPPHPANTESDDEDFHSTSDNDDTAVSLSTPQQTQQGRGEGHQLECPLCNLSFPMNSMRLLEQHINSHLEHVCPVCSVAFQRNSQKKFFEHVHSHFQEEEGSRSESEEWTNPLDDPSGPWGRQCRSARLLEID